MEEDSTVELLGRDLTELWATFEENHAKFLETGNKSAAARARKALGEIKKHVTGYRKASVDECNQ